MALLNSATTTPPASAIGPVAGHASADVDVDRPAQPGTRDGHQAHHIVRLHPATGQDVDAGRSQDHPDEVEPATRAQDGDRERAPELNRHGDAERDPRQGDVEAVSYTHLRAHET